MGINNKIISRRTKLRGCLGTSADVGIYAFSYLSKDCWNANWGVIYPAPIYWLAIVFTLCTTYIQLNLCSRETCMGAGASCYIYTSFSDLYEGLRYGGDWTYANTVLPNIDTCIYSVTHVSRLHGIVKCINPTNPFTYIASKRDTWSGNKGWRVYTHEGYLLLNYPSSVRSNPILMAGFSTYLNF